MTDIRINLNQIETDDINTSVFASKSEVNLVQDNVQALDNNVWVNANDFTTYSTVTANVYDTYTTLTANDYSTYNTLSGLIDTVQDNVSSQNSNTSIVAGGTDLSNTTVFIEAGDGVLLSSNTTSKTMTIATSMSNVTSQTISIDGTANSFTLTKSAANANMILVMYNGLVQDPSRYTISGTTLTLNNVAPIIAGANVEVRYFDFFSLPGVSESSGGGGSYSFQGSNFGYTSGGDSLTDIIDKFSFSSDLNATDVGELSRSVRTAAGQNSSNHGYTSGGASPGSPAGLYSNVIDKFPFSSDSSATDVDDLSVGRQEVTGQSSSTSGYSSGGIISGNSAVDTIDKFPFSEDSNATDVGNLISIRSKSAGQSSTTDGYNSGSGNGLTHTIDKFPFSSDSNATDVGELSSSVYLAAGQSSTTHGYTSGGAPGPEDKIQKFPFSSDTSSTEIGQLTRSSYGSAGQSSTTHGYTSGGAPGPHNTIDKFLFSSDANATDVGELTQSRSSTTGTQY